MRHTSEGHCDDNCEAIPDAENVIFRPQTTGVDSELPSSHYHYWGTQTEAIPDIENATLGPQTTGVDSELPSPHYHYQGTQPEAIPDAENVTLGPQTTGVDSELPSPHYHHQGTQTDVLHQTISTPSKAEEQNMAVLGIPEFGPQSGNTTIANTLAVTDSSFTNSIVNIWPSGKTSSTDVRFVV